MSKRVGLKCRRPKVERSPRTKHANIFKFILSTLPHRPRPASWRFRRSGPRSAKIGQVGVGKREEWKRELSEDAKRHIAVQTDE